MALEFVDKNTLYKMTGKKYPKVQARWLKKHGIPWTYAGDGTLNVLATDYLKKFALKSTTAASKNQEPEFEAIRVINGKKTAKKQAPTAEGDL